MVLPRFAATRASSLLNVARSARTARSAELQPWRRVAQRSGRRGYASGHGHEEEGSSLPWALGATVVTIPSLYLLLKDPEAHKFPPLGPSAHGKAAHHEHDEEHDEGGEEHAEEEPKEESSEEQPKEETPEESKEEGGEEQPKEESKDEQPAEEHKEEGQEGERKDEDKKEGGKPQPKDLSGTRKTEPDAKGGTKVRVNSELGKNVSQGPSEREDASGSSKDAAVPNKEPLSGNQISGKQKGLSNTPTRHTEDPTNDPNKSKKSEGSVESSKSMGTVDPGRPQSGNKEA